MIGTENYLNPAPPDANFEFYNIKDDPGDSSGTLINVQTNSDLQQFLRKLVALAGLTPNGLPDNLTNGYQSIDALFTVINQKIAAWPITNAWVNTPVSASAVGGGSISLGSSVLYSKISASGKTRNWQIRIEGATVAGSPTLLAFNETTLSGAQWANPGMYYLTGINNFTNPLLIELIAGSLKFQISDFAGNPFTNDPTVSSFYISITAEVL